MKIKRVTILWRILKYTHTDRILIVYVLFTLLAALLVLLTEPTITNYLDALWYCYAVTFTVGFGDFTTTLVFPRLLSLAVSVYSTVVIAIVTGVIVKYINEQIDRQNNETLTAFLDKVERLPELSKEELKELSDKVSAFRNKREI